MKNQKNDIEKAKELNKKQAAKIETLKTGACFGKCDFSDKNCTSCVIFAVCAEKRELDKIKAATAKIKNTAKKAPVKKSTKKITLSTCFYIAVRQSGLIFSLDKVAKNYQFLLDSNLKTRTPQKSALRSFAAHIKNCFDKKEEIFTDRFLSLRESGSSVWLEQHSGNLHADNNFVNFYR